jgi:serine/threonine protein kinase
MNKIGVTNKINATEIIHREPFAEGSYSIIDKAKLQDGSSIIIKSNKAGRDGIDYQSLCELQCLSLLRDSPYIISMLGVNFTEDRNKFIITEIYLPFYQYDMVKFISVVGQAERIAFYQDVKTQLMKGLSYMHSQGVIHQDVKPANILIEYDHSVTCCFTDFGNSKSQCHPLSDRWRETTPCYKAPELLHHECGTAKSDIWALGASLVEYLSGEVLIYPASCWNRCIAKCIVNKLYSRNHVGDYFEILTNTDDTIDVDDFLFELLEENLYKEFDKREIELLECMLHINPDLRLDIQEMSRTCCVDNLWLSHTCWVDTGKVPLTRGCVDWNEKCQNKHEKDNFIPDEEIDHYYVMTDIIINLAKIFKFHVRTILVALDALARYMVKNKVSNLTLVAVTCLFLVSIMTEVKPVGLTDFVQEINRVQQQVSVSNLSADQIKTFEVDLIQVLDYIIVRDDELLEMILEIDEDPIQLVTEVYSEFKRLHTNPGRKDEAILTLQHNGLL